MLDFSSLICYNLAFEIDLVAIFQLMLLVLGQTRS